MINQSVNYNPDFLILKELYPFFFLLIYLNLKYGLQIYFIFVVLGFLLILIFPRGLWNMNQYESA